MAKVSRFEHYGEAYGFNCPGCERMHIIPVTGTRGWEFNHSLDAPTFKPSILARFNFNGDVPSGICHSFVTDGNIQFLNDCTHKLAGQTVPLTEIEKPTPQQDR